MVVMVGVIVVFGIGFVLSGILMFLVCSLVVC